MNLDHVIKRMEAATDKNLVGGFVAGGALTSCFTRKDIADIDFYPRDDKSLYETIRNLYEDGKYCRDITDKSLTFVDGENIIQVIHFEEFSTPEVIFNIFDFTCCMCAYDVDKKNIHMHESFVLHCSQRLLKFNPNTRFPIASALRVKKYQEKGFYIPQMEHVKILLACSRVEIKSWDEFKSQIGGFYGNNVKIPDSAGDFSIDKAMALIENIDIGAYPNSGPADWIEAYIRTTKKQINGFQTSDGVLLFNIHGYPSVLEFTPKNFSLGSLIDVFGTDVFYKVVKKTAASEFSSIYRVSFKYEIGKAFSSPTPGVFLKTFQQIKDKEYGAYKPSLTNNVGDSVIIEVKIDQGSVVAAKGGYDKDVIRTLSGTPIAERPLSFFQ